MNRNMNSFNRTFVLVLLVIVMLLPALGFSKYYDGSGGTCALAPGRTCFHVFNSTQTPTTADHDIFQVNMCRDGISYRFDGDGVALLQVKECSEPSKTGDCSTFTPDMNNDSVIDSTDEATMLDGVTPGLRGFERMFPRAPWHWIDVIAVPASGSVRLTISCH